MNLLMVDDDTLFLKKLQETLRYNEIGIDMVFTAGNIRQAIEVFHKYPVDILLSDIEMPQGSGLELLQWIRDQNYQVECIFLSSYAYFAYAQKALVLKSSEYLLKPVSERELEKVLQEIVDSRRVKTGDVSAVQPEKVKYWTNILEGHVETDQHKVLPQGRFFLYWIRFASPTGEDRQYIDYCLEHFGGMEPDMEEMVPACVIPVSDYNWVMVFATGLGNDAERERAANIRNLLFKRTGGVFYIYGAGVMDIHQAAAMKKRLGLLSEEAVCGQEGILFLWDWESRNADFAAPAWESWETAAVHGDTVLQTKESILVYLSEYASQGRLTVEILRTFRKELMQMIYNCLSRQNVAVTSIFGDEEFDRYYELSVCALSHMESFVTYMLDKLHGYNSQDNRQEAVVREICHYIEQHLKEEISRKQLAALVYLSEDYVSKIFSGVTGMTLPAYIMRCRMMRAKEYLGRTDWTISRIAIETGYSNFSYFSKNFRDYTGMTPNEFREQKRKA